MMSARAGLVACIFLGGIFFWFMQGRIADSGQSLPVNLHEEDVSRFVSEMKARMVFVEGGGFLMGDYGASYGEERVQLDSDKDSKPPHELVLSSYYIDKYKVTNEDFDRYLKYRGYARRTDTPPSMYSTFRTYPRLPAHLDWFETEKYCAWLGEVSGLPFSMATEAQWEYAARSRGQFLAVATDDGTYRYETSDAGDRVGVNISSSRSREDFAKKLGWDTRWMTPLPVDHYPPNALGVYSMSDGGREWVSDWYSPDYYKRSPVNDPQGPEEPLHKDYFGFPTKVMRGQSRADEYWTVGINVHRFPVNPYAYISDDNVPSLVGRTARCVINTSGSIK